MNANRVAPLAAVSAAFGLALLVASCSAPPPPPPPRPLPAPRPTYRPPPPPLPAPKLSWREEPITPGTWRWSLYGSASSARFGEGAAGPLLELRCDRASGKVLLLRTGAATAPLAMTITTTGTSRPLIAAPLAGPQPMIVATLPARDSLLDAIAFSRGRFMVEVQGLAPVYAPSWPELSRVIEDCR